jgi:hypothetical protein
VLLHQPHHLLVVDDDRFIAKLRPHPAIAVRRPFGADFLDAFTSRASSIGWLAGSS